MIQFKDDSRQAERGANLPRRVSWNSRAQRRCESALLYWPDRPLPGLRPPTRYLDMGDAQHGTAAPACGGGAVTGGVVVMRDQRGMLTERVGVQLFQSTSDGRMQLGPLLEQLSVVLHLLNERVAKGMRPLDGEWIALDQCRPTEGVETG